MLGKAVTPDLMDFTKYFLARGPAVPSTTLLKPHHSESGTVKGQWATLLKMTSENIDMNFSGGSTINNNAHRLPTISLLVEHSQWWS